MSAHTDPFQTNFKVKETELSNNLCYCVPEFSNLDMAHLPETSDLLRELANKLDNSGYTRLRTIERERELAH